MSGTMLQKFRFIIITQVLETEPGAPWSPLRHVLDQQRHLILRTQFMLPDTDYNPHQCAYPAEWQSAFHAYLNVCISRIPGKIMFQNAFCSISLNDDLVIYPFFNYIYCHHHNGHYHYYHVVNVV